MIRPTVKGDREGRGFSRDELSQAGLPITKAKKLGFVVDLRRRSINIQNIELLKAKSKEIEAELKNRVKAKRAKRVTKEAKKEKPVKAEKKKVEKPKKKAAEKAKVSKKKEKTMPLTEVKGLGPKTAKRLEDAGVKSANKLAKSDLKKLSEKTGIPTKVLERYVAEASKLK